MPQFQLALFGSFQLTIAGQPVEQFRSLREAALLAYLAVEAERPHLRPHLAGLLWPDLPEESARNNLKQTLLNLRNAIQDRQAQPAFLHVERATLQFNQRSDQWVDVLVFSEALKATATHTHADLLTCADCQARLAQAIALYRGPLLATFSLTRSDLFEEWLLLTREKYHHQAIVACAQLSEIYAHQGHITEALAVVRRQVELDPFSEAAYRRLLQWLAASGQRGEALNAFSLLRTRLTQELKVEPSPETLALVAQIRADGISKPSPTTATPPPQVESPKTAVPHHAPRQDWDGASQPTFFLGRAQEVATIGQWLQAGVNLVAIVGLAGMGKSTLAYQAARSFAEQFACVIWRTLLNAPPLEELLSDWLYFLTGQAAASASTTLDEKLNLLMVQLRSKRCLLILDQVEAILQGEQAGRYRSDYEGYGQLLQRIAREAHQSCLLFTSREEPQTIVRLLEETPLVRALQLTGLAEAAGQALLQAHGLRLSHQAAAPLLQRYSGSPALLQFVAHTIHELFNDDVAAFLAQGTPVFGEIRDAFDQYRLRIPYTEKVILLWLAIEREPVSAATVQAALVPPVSSSLFFEALHALQRRSFLEQTPQGFTVTQVVMDNLIDFWLERAYQEIVAAQPAMLNHYPLLKAQASPSIRQTQVRVILAPLVERLLTHFGRAGLISQLQRILARVRQTEPALPGYLVGNLLNLLLYLRADVRGLELANLYVWQAYLANANLMEVNFQDANLRGSIFIETFTASAPQPDHNATHENPITTSCYCGMNLIGATGLSDTQKVALKALNAVVE